MNPSSSLPADTRVRVAQLHMSSFISLQAEVVLLTAVPQGKELSLTAFAQHTRHIYCVIAPSDIGLHVFCFPGDLHSHPELWNLIAVWLLWLKATLTVVGVIIILCVCVCVCVCLLALLTEHVTNLVVCPKAHNTTCSSCLVLLHLILQLSWTMQGKIS